MWNLVLIARTNGTAEVPMSKELNLSPLALVHASFIWEGFACEP